MPNLVLTPRAEKSLEEISNLAKPVAHNRQIIVHDTFKIIYRITRDRIEVIEIFHGCRNPGLIRDISK